MPLRVEIADKVAYTAVKFQIRLNRLAAVRTSRVNELYPYSGIEERLLAHTVEQNIIFKNRGFKNFGVGLEGHLESVGLVGCFALALEGARNVSAFKSFGISYALVYVVHFQPLGQRVDD